MMFKNVFKNKRNKIYLVPAVLLPAACLWAFLYAGAVTKNFTNKIAENTLNAKEAGVENLLITETKDGAKLWEMFADNGNYTEKNGIVFLENLLGNVYEENRVKASFKADRGTYNTENKQIILYDNVIMVYEDGTSINTDKLIYSGSEKDIIAEGRVKILRPNEAAVSGSKAVLSGDYKKFDIQGCTVTHFYMQEKQETSRQ